MTTNPPPEHERDSEVDPVVAKLLRQLDEGENLSPDQIENQFRDQLTPRQLQDVKAAHQCLLELGQFRELSDQTDRVNSDLSTLNPNDATMELQPVCRTTTSELRPNQQFGRYLIKGLQGEGGFSKVYLAHDEVLNRDVALKIPRNDIVMTSLSIARFKREASAVAALSHPAIIPVFDSGTINNNPFIAFEFCDGATLAEQISGDRPDVQTSARLIARLAEAIEHAHRNGVVHRDLKPANILIEKSDTAPLVDRVRITDFGLAYQLDEHHQKLTVTGTLVGTPAYMSPEQIDNDQNVDKSTDIYSLGVMLYELLTGKVPHRKSSYASTLHSITSQPISSLPKSDNEIFPDLEAICLKCLARRPTDRYLSAFELSQDLNRFIDGFPTKARKIGYAGQLLRWSRRNPALAISLAATALVLITGIMTTGWMWLQSEQNRFAAVEIGHREIEARRTAEARSDELEKQVEILNSIFEELNPWHDELDDADLRQRIGDRLGDAVELILESSSDAELQVSMLNSLSDSLKGIGRKKEAIEVAEKALQIAEQNEVSRELFLNSKLALAFAMIDHSNHIEGRKILEEFQTEILANPSFSDGEKAWVFFMLGEQRFSPAYDINSLQGLDEAATAFKMALTLTKNDETKNGERETSCRLASRFRLAEISQISNANGLEELKAVVAETESELGLDHALTLSMLGHLSEALSKLNKYAKAIATANICYRRCLKKYGEESDRVFVAMDALVVACGRGNNSKSKAILREILPKAQQLCERIVDRDGFSDPKTILRCGNVASGWAIVGKLDECIAMKTEIVNLATEQLGRNHPTTQFQLMGLGYTYRAAGRLDEAQSALEEFIDFAKSNPDRDHKPWQVHIRTANRELLIIKGLRLFSSE